MKFNDLSSQVIKSSLVGKLAYSLGFKAISSTLKAKRPLQLDFESGETDYTPLHEAELAKRKWATFVEWAETYGYDHSSIEEIAAKYVLSSGKPVQATPDNILELRAKASGISLTQLKAQADKARLVTQAKVQYQVDKVIHELSDIQEYANGFYNHDTVADDGTLVHSSVDIEEVITDEWVEANYEKAMQAQVAFWSKYNNWDDAELVLMLSDKQFLGL